MKTSPRLLGFRARIMNCSVHLECVMELIEGYVVEHHYCLN